MARTIGFSQSVGANALVAQVGAVNDSRYNPVERTSRVSLYAAQVAAGQRVNFSLGADSHAEEVEPATAAAVSTRDHLIAQGVAFAGQKITVGVRNSTAGAVVTNGLVVIEPA